MVKKCNICKKEIDPSEYRNTSTGRPVPAFKRKSLYALGYCQSCLEAYKQAQAIKKAVNNPKKRREYEKKLQEKVDAGILTQEQMDEGLRQVDEQFKNKTKKL